MLKLIMLLIGGRSRCPIGARWGSWPCAIAAAGGDLLAKPDDSRGDTAAI